MRPRWPVVSCKHYCERQDRLQACKNSRSADSPDPDPFGGGLAEVNARRAAAGDGKSHGFVIFALVNAKARSGSKIEIHEKLEKVRIFLVNAQNFVRVAHFGFRKAHRAMFAAEILHAAEERNAVRAATVAPETLEKQSGDFRRNSVLEALGFIVGARPIEADHFGEKFFGKLMAHSEVLGDFATLCGERDVPVRANAQKPSRVRRLKLR